VFIVCVDLCAVFRLIVVLFSVMCVICVLCLVVVPLPQGENPFAVQINNSKNECGPWFCMGAKLGL
jgi:type IV secretory pathway component VirB8